jgi:L-iditol 2-dehydrogenase
MKAAVLKAPYRISVEELRIPVPASDQVLIQVESCGVCGSDIRYFMGENPWAMHTLGRHVPNPPNIVLGHELSGVVVKSGSGAFDDLVGRRIAVLPYLECGRCPECRDGKPNLCSRMLHTGHSAGWGQREYYDGGMADFCPMWGVRCFPVPDSMSFEDAALTDFVGVAVHAVRLASDVRERDVAVIGAGPVGLSIAQVARAWGARKVFLAERSPLAVRIARGMGFDRAASLGDRPIDDWLLEGTHGLGVRCVWDTVGSADTLGQGIRSLARQGSLVNLAVHDVSVSVAMPWLAAERALMSSSNSTPADVRDAIDLVCRGAVDVRSMITHRFPLEQTPHAFTQLVEKDLHGMFKVLIEVRQQNSEQLPPRNRS